MEDHCVTENGDSEEFKLGASDKTSCMIACVMRFRQRSCYSRAKVAGAGRKQTLDQSLER
jgi:hypothetical protein